MTQQVAPPPQPLPAPVPWAGVRPTDTEAVLAVSLLWCAPAAIVLGVLARREIRRTGEGGWGPATWGMALGVAGASLSVAHVLFVVLHVAVLLVAGLAAAAGADPAAAALAAFP